MVHGVVQRQQTKPREERPRICLYLDEAHYFMTRVLESMLSTGRDAGLEVTAAWQHSGQIEDRRVVKGLSALIQTRISFKTNDVEEAREIAQRAAAAYAGNFKGTQEDRDNTRITPDILLNLEHHYGLLEPTVAGDRVKFSFDLTRVPGYDPGLAQTHLEKQIERGGYYAEDLPDISFSETTRPTATDGAFEEPASAKALEYLDTLVAKGGRNTEQLARHFADAMGVEPPTAALAEQQLQEMRGRIGKAAVSKLIDLLKGDDVPQTAATAGDAATTPAAPEAQPAVAAAGDQEPVSDVAEPRAEDARADDLPLQPAASTDEPQEREPPRDSEAAPPQWPLERPGALAAPPQPALNTAPAPAGPSTNGASPPQPEALEEAPRRARASAPSNPVDADALTAALDPAAAGGIARSSARPPAEGAAAAPMPDTLAELVVGDAREITWNAVNAPAPKDTWPEWRDEQLQVLTHLYHWGPLTTGQIGRIVFRSERNATRYLGGLHKCGLVRRFKFRTNVQHSCVYVLREEGFLVARDTPSSNGRSYIPEDAKWREPEINDARPVLHNLHAAGWALTATYVGGQFIKRCRGARETATRIGPPRGLTAPSDLLVRAGRSVGGLKLEQFTPFQADARLDVVKPGEGWTHLYVELDRTGKPSKNIEKMHNYDALITGYAPYLDAYKDQLPVAIFVCADPASVLAFLREADEAITGWIAGAAAKDVDKVYPGRLRTWFVAESDIHFGSFRALRLPDHPPDLRAKLGEPAKCKPVQKTLFPDSQLRPAPWVYESERSRAGRAVRQPAASPA
jgi:hypothetical protein